MLITAGTTKTFTWQFFSWDHLGSVRVVTDVNGAKLYDSKYLPYGDEITGTTSPGSDNAHKFTGHERDLESGTDYMGARYFQSSLERFMSPDPSTESITSSRPTSWNRYEYVRNNPVKSFDATGRAPTDIHQGTSELILWIVGFDLDFARSVAWENGFTDENPETTWRLIANTRTYHAFDCDGACLQIHMAIFDSIKPTDIRTIGRAMHFVGDQPFHGAYSFMHGLHADDLKTHKGEFLEMIHHEMDSAMKMKGNPAFAGMAGPQRSMFPSDDFWGAFADMGGAITDNGDGMTIWADTEAGARSLHDMLAAEQIPLNGIQFGVKSSDTRFDERADGIRGDNSMGFSTMPKDCGARGQDGSC